MIWISEKLNIRNRTHKFVLAIAVGISTLILLWPIVGSPFSGDDTFDSIIPMKLHYTGQSPWSYINDYVSGWAAREGRFFPVAAIVGTFSHYFFTGRVEYKIVQLIIVFVAIFLFALFVSKLFRNFFAGVLSVMIINTCLQIHVQYDPLIQFSLQQPFLLSMISGSLLCFVCGIRSKNNWQLAGSAIFYSLALLTYESALLIWPIFIILLFVERPKQVLKNALTITVPAVIVGLNLVRLRSQVSTTTAGYTSDFELGRLTTTFAKQAIGSLPMSFSELHPPPFMQSFPGHLNLTSIWWLIGVGISVILVPVVLPKVSSPNHRLNLGIILLGSVLWFMPAFVVAQTVRWQNELVLGNAYITWFQGSFGFTLIAIGIILECKLLLAKFSKSVSISALSLLALIIGIATSSVITNNPQAVAQYNPGYKWPREVFENSIQAGVFSEVSAQQPVLALGIDWWFDPSFVYWWGGPKIERMDSQNANVSWQSCLAEPQTCINRIGYEKVVVALGNDWDSLQKSSPKVVMVGKLSLMTGVPGAVSSAIVSAPRIYVEFPKQFRSPSELKGHCQQWAELRVPEKMSPVEAEDVTIVKTTNKTCLVEFSSRISFDAYKFNLS